jgi:hypothetical protein
MIRLRKLMPILLFLGVSLSCSKERLENESYSKSVHDDMEVTLVLKFNIEKNELDLVFLNLSKTEYLHIIDPSFSLGNIKFDLIYQNENLVELPKNEKFVTQSGFEGRVIDPGSSFIVKENIIFGAEGSIKFENSEQSFIFSDKTYKNSVDLHVSVAVSVSVSNFVSGKCRRLKLVSETVVVEAPLSWMLGLKDDGRIDSKAKQKKEDGKFTLPPAPLPSQ